MLNIVFLIFKILSQGVGGKVPPYVSYLCVQESFAAAQDQNHPQPDIRHILMDSLNEFWNSLKITDEGY